MDEYGTHIPVLNEIFQFLEINNVLEFGMGNNSTPLLIKSCKGHVTSVEMQQQEWYETVVEQNLSNDDKWTPILALGSHEILSNTDVVNKHYDLVFVDGHGDSRPECINHFFGKTDIIVAHDVETPSYRWELVNTPPEYVMYYYGKENPATAVYSNNHQLIEYLKNKLGS